MARNVLSHGKLECLGLKDPEKPDKNPPLNEPVQILIKLFNDGTKKIVCPHISDARCEAGPGEETSRIGGRYGNLIYHGVDFPICLHYKYEAIVAETDASVATAMEDAANTDDDD